MRDASTSTIEMLIFLKTNQNYHKTISFRIFQKMMQFGTRVFRKGNIRDTRNKFYQRIYSGKKIIRNFIIVT